MTKNINRLRAMYILNILGAGVPGALITFFNIWSVNNMFVTQQDPAMLGILGSIWFAIALISMIGLRFPQQLKVIFAMQIIYKSTWILVIALPLIAQGRRDDVIFYVYLFLAVAITFVIGLFGDAQFLKLNKQNEAKDLS